MSSFKRITKLSSKCITMYKSVMHDSNVIN